MPSFGNNPDLLDAIFKEWYSSDGVEESVFKKHVFFGMAPKKEDLSGRHYNFALHWGNGMGRSRSFPVAQAMAAKTGELYSTFQVSLVEDNAVANIDSETIDKSYDTRGAFVKAITKIPDANLNNMARDLNVKLWRTTDASIGQIGAISNGLVTMKNVKDIYNIEIGMTLDLAASQVSGNVRAYGSAGHGLYVTRINQAKGQFNVGVNPQPGATGCDVTDATDGIIGAQVNDYIYPTGDRNESFAGATSWIPYTDPTAGESFYGVDRSVNRALLAGLAYDGSTGSSIASVIESAMARSSEIGGEPDTCFMTFKKWNDLAMELGAKAQLVDVESTNVKVGYKGIRVAGNSGEVVCVADRNCPSTTMLLTKMDTWKILSMRKCIRVWDDDGMTWLRHPSASGVEMRFQSRRALICEEPRHSTNILVAA